MQSFFDPIIIKSYIFELKGVRHDLKTHPRAIETFHSSETHFCFVTERGSKMDQKQVSF